MHLSGFQLQNHYDGYNLRQLSAVVDALAEFHAVGTAMLADSDHDDGGSGEEALVERFAKLLDSVESKINAKRRQHAGEHSTPDSQCKLRALLGAYKWLARGCENVAGKLRQRWYAGTIFT